MMMMMKDLIMNWIHDFQKDISTSDFAAQYSTAFASWQHYLLCN